MNWHVDRTAIAIYFIVLGILVVVYPETLVGGIAAFLLLLSFLVVVIGALLNFIRVPRGRPEDKGS